MKQDKHKKMIWGKWNKKNGLIFWPKIFCAKRCPRYCCFLTFLPKQKKNCFITAAAPADATAAVRWWRSPRYAFALANPGACCYSTQQRARTICTSTTYVVVFPTATLVRPFQRISKKAQTQARRDAELICRFICLLVRTYVRTHTAVHTWPC